MSWFKRALGLDPFDFFVHVAVTLLLVGLALDSHEDEAVFGLLIGSLVLLSIRRWWAFRKRPPLPAGFGPGEDATTRYAELEQRLELLEIAEARIAELEERVDFTERMLAHVNRERPVELPAHRD